jgi:hypothetical protein
MSVDFNWTPEDCSNLICLSTTKLTMLLDPVSKLPSELLSVDSRARFLLCLLGFWSFFLSLAIYSIGYVIWSGSLLPGLFQGFFAESKGFVSLSFWLPSLLNGFSWGSPSRALPHGFAFPSWVLANLPFWQSLRPWPCWLGLLLVWLLHASGRCDKMWQDDTQNEYLASA